MKKIFTLLFAAGSITFASAQSMGQKNSSFKNNQKETVNMNAYPSHKNDSYGNYSSSLKEKEAQIKKINREYDQKIAAVKKSRYLREKEKSKQIRALESQRNTAIKQVQLRFDKNNSHKW